MAVESRVFVRGLHLAYLDFGGAGVPVVALHGHFGRSRMWAGLAESLAPDYRVVALEQRGHGHSDRDGDFGREVYVADAAAFIRHLDAGPVVVLGHSRAE